MQIERDAVPEPLNVCQLVSVRGQHRQEAPDEGVQRLVAAHRRRETQEGAQVVGEPVAVEVDEIVELGSVAPDGDQQLKVLGAAGEHRTGTQLVPPQLQHVHHLHVLVRIETRPFDGLCRLPYSSSLLLILCSILKQLTIIN